MILTVTANTAIDRLVETSKSDGSEVLFPSGKGINVARALACLSIPVRALAFVGESEISLFESLNDIGIDALLQAVPGPTRENVTVVRRGGPQSKQAKAVGYSVRPEELQIFEDTLRRASQDADGVVFSGSLPAGAPPESYRRWIQMVSRPGLFTILDSSGAAFRHGVTAAPSLVKPNLQEFYELLGEPIGSIDETVQRLKAFVLTRAVVSMGSDGCLCRNDDTVIWSRLADSIRVERGSAVGSGDAMVGALAASIQRGLSLAEGVKLAVAAGAANILTSAPGGFDRASMDALVPCVRTDYLE